MWVVPSRQGLLSCSTSWPAWAGVHVNYQETKLHIRDRLPKLKDIPQEMGGSGLTVAE